MIDCPMPAKSRQIVIIEAGISSAFAGLLTQKSAEFRWKGESVVPSRPESWRKPAKKARMPLR